MNETFGEFVKYLAGAAALGVVASSFVSLLKVALNIEGTKAKIISVIAAAVVNVVANLFMPYLDRLPPQIAQFWPVAVWIASQIWYELTKPKVAAL